MQNALIAHLKATETFSSSNGVILTDASGKDTLAFMEHCTAATRQDLKVSCQKFFLRYPKPDDLINSLEFATAKRKTAHQLGIGSTPAETQALQNAATLFHHKVSLYPPQSDYTAPSDRVYVSFGDSYTARKDATLAAITLNNMFAAEACPKMAAKTPSVLWAPPLPSPM